MRGGRGALKHGANFLGKFCATERPDQGHDPDQNHQLDGTPKNHARENTLVVMLQRGSLTASESPIILAKESQALDGRSGSINTCSEAKA